MKVLFGLLYGSIDLLIARLFCNKHERSEGTYAIDEFLAEGQLGSGRLSNLLVALSRSGKSFKGLPRSQAFRDLPQRLCQSKALSYEMTTNIDLSTDNEIDSAIRIS